MRVVVPFAADQPKTRLGELLAPAERRGFARAMLHDVLDALGAAGYDPTVLATAPLDLDAPTTVDDRPLSTAVDAVLDDGPAAVVMADLPLATPAALSKLFDASGDVVLAPGRGGGTNALVARHPEFRTDFHGTSYLDHRRAAKRVGARVETVDSFRLATDIDEPADLAEVLIHTTGAARDWLVDAGIDLATNETGRVTVRRDRIR
jgi:2-phospho-L-lactate/phosphoenolpyruvate guanylyltransferase